MQAVTPWFGRSFDRHYPADLLLPLLSRLRGAPARLEELMRGSERADLIAKLNGEWSAQENAGHLADLEPLWLARVEDYLSCRTELTPADLGNRRTDDANHNARPLETVLADFRAARETLMRRLATVDIPGFREAIPHPRLKTPMTLPDHLYFVAEHDDHHLARIWTLLDARRWREREAHI